MVNYQQQKQNIKNFLIEIENNRVSESELLALKNKLGSLSVSELKSLKEVIKDLLKDKIDKELEKSMKANSNRKWIINPYSEKWLESELKDFCHALINLTFSIFDENVLREVMVLENQTELSTEEKIKRFIPVLVQQVNKITTRKKSTNISNYEKVEDSIITKWEKIFSLKEQELSAKNLKEAGDTFKSLSDDEIKVTKEKTKKIIISQSNDWIPIKFSQSDIAGIKQVFKFCIELADTTLDDEIIISIWRAIGDFYDEVLTELESIEKLGDLIQEKLQLTHNQTKIKKIIQQLTQHLNNLAGETGNQVSESAKELIAAEINSVQNVSGRSGPRADLKNHFGFLRFLGEGSSYASSSAVLGDALKIIGQIDFKRDLTSRQKKMGIGKKIGLLVFFGFLIGGITSLFIYSQKRKRNEN